MGRLQVCLEPTNNPNQLEPLHFFEKIGKKETIAKAFTIICRC
jgi:hypothetical protein